MELPDIKVTAKQALDGLNGTPLGVFLVAMTEKGHCCTFVGGIPDVIIRALKNVMNENSQIKELVEEAWCQTNDNHMGASFDPNLN